MSHHDAEVTFRTHPHGGAAHNCTCPENPHYTYSSQIPCISCKKLNDILWKHLLEEKPKFLRLRFQLHKIGKNNNEL